jgi:hypothetical protein
MLAISPVRFGKTHRESGRSARGAGLGAKSMRREDSCINCGEVREIAAHGLCFKCYRKEERTKDQQCSAVDRHNPGIRREHKKLFRGFTSVMTALSDLGVQRSDVLAIRKTIEPYLGPIANFLAPATDKDEVERAVNGEQKSDE